MLTAGETIIHVSKARKAPGPKQSGPNLHVWISTKQRDAFVYIATANEACEPLSYQELANKLSLAVGTVQHHLAKLKAVGLIETANSRRSIRLTAMGKAAWENFKARRK
jgi:DNA-binding MarR family transcriptional regulator